MTHPYAVEFETASSAKFEPINGAAKFEPWVPYAVEFEPAYSAKCEPLNEAAKFEPWVPYAVEFESASSAKFEPFNEAANSRKIREYRPVKVSRSIGRLGVVAKRPSNCRCS